MREARVKIALTLLIFTAGLAASLTLTARADTVTLADLPGLGYTLALQFNVQTQCGNYVVTGGNGAPETLIGDPQHASCQAPGAIEERIAALLSAYPPAQTTSTADPVTVTVMNMETSTEFVTTTAPAVTVTRTATLVVPTTTTAFVERVVASPVETVIQTQTVTERALACAYRANGALPDAVCTPGALNPAVTQATIRTTICKTGWTRTIRPPSSWTRPHELAAMQAYSAQGPPSDYEYDHLIPLELGGAPRDTLNLWPEPHASSFTKDATENRLKRAVCSGSLSLAAAQAAIRTDWRTAP